MNLKKLQAMQAKLDEAILKEKAPMTAEERFNKTLVALSVEIAEVANTVEHFKFWKDNKGKVDKSRFIEDWDYTGAQVIGYYDKQDGFIASINYEKAHRLTLIEECSDALHFILSLANQLGWDLMTGHNSTRNLDKRYLSLQKLIDEIDFQRSGCEAQTFMDNFMGYILLLDITPQELEQAYYDKNKVNYERLENGY